MKKLGCLVVILAVCAGIYWFSSMSNLSDEEKARIVGEKVHRGWNQVREVAHNAQEGWNKVEDTSTSQTQPPAKDKPN